MNLEQLIQDMPKGRLLTPQEGCGYTKASNTRIVGGSAAKVGKSIDIILFCMELIVTLLIVVAFLGAWPWLTLLGYHVKKKDETEFACGKH